MNKITLATRSLAISLFILTVSSLAYGQATRTWVSGVGNDANPCSRTAPCKTFAGAFPKTATNGEIDALDPGGFGAVTITKSITIDGAGTLAGILASLTTGVIINGAGANVIIRNVTIDGAGNGIDGIRILQANSVVLENVQIFGFTGIGVKWVPTSADGFLTVKNTSIQNCILGGISMVNSAGFGRGLIINSMFHRNLFGVKAGALTGVSVTGSVATECTDGFLGDGGQAQMNLDLCTASHNTTGVKVNNGAAVRISNSLISNNTSFGCDFISGFLESYQNNMIRGNPSSDAPTPVMPS